MLFIALTTFGQTYSERTVSQFGEYMQRWCTTKDYHFRKSVEAQCQSGCRVSDKIMEQFAAENDILRSLHLQDYVLEGYLDCFKNAINKGTVSYSMSNVKTISEDQQIHSSYGNSTVQQEVERSKKITTVACDISITGALNFHVKDLYYIYQGKVKKITPYEEVVDPNTGQKKVKVDFSDLVDEHSLEVSYGYSSHFPLNIGVSTNFSYFNIGVEYGMNFSEEMLLTQKHTNYATSTLERGKYWYLMATPGVYLRYASIDCGLGNVFAKYNYNYESVYTSSSNSEKKNYFIMKPKLTFHIPIPLDFSSRTEKLYISPHVGYNYVPKCSALNCWEVGIGVRFRFETY